MISLLHPSRGRPVKAIDTARKWIQNAGIRVEHILSIDKLDPLRDHYRALDRLILNDNKSVVEATNQAAKCSTGNILIYLSDDFDCFPDWAIKLIELTEQYTGQWILKVNDGIERIPNLLTIPIMSRELYERLGYFFHPSYKSMVVDKDLFYTCQQLGVIKTHMEITFQHLHHSIRACKEDEIYRRSRANLSQGKQLFLKRKREGFL